MVPDLNEDFAGFEKEAAKWRRELVQPDNSKKNNQNIDQNVENQKESEIKFLRKDILYLENSALSVKKQRDALKIRSRKFSIFMTPAEPSPSKHL